MEKIIMMIYLLTILIIKLFEIKIFKKYINFNL